MYYSIVFPSAYEFWMNQPGPMTEYLFNKTVTNKKKPSVDHEKLLNEMKYLQLKLPIHIATYPTYRTNTVPEIQYHTFRKNSPKNSYIALSDHLCVSSPELCFLQAATQCSLAELVEIANNLCSMFCFNEYTELGMKSRIPITKVSSISSYLKNAPNAYGIKKARQAIKYALDNSFSPVESKLGVKGLLPLPNGGFGIEKPELNKLISLNNEVADFFGSDQIYSDMVWDNHKVALEYDSNLTHLSIKQHYRDKRRITALNNCGYTVFSVTYENISSFTAINNLFLLVRKQLGYRNYQDRFDRYEKQRRQVYHELFGRENIFHNSNTIRNDMFGI